MTNGERSGANGGQEGTGGIAPQTLRRALIAVLLAFPLLQGTANVLSRIADLRSLGDDTPAWSVALDEASSLAAWFVCMVAIWFLVRELRPPRFRWTAAFALHALATVPVSLLHIGLMIGLRQAVHAVMGLSYRVSSGFADVFLYEYRKDALTYALLALTMAAIQWFARASDPAPAPSDDGPAAIAVADGAVTHRIPASDILWAEAAGNYVTLHWSGGEILHRCTLSALERELAGQGFARIHRSRIVRRHAVRRVETVQSGDFTLTLEDGTELRGSRRFREGLRRG